MKSTAGDPRTVIRLLISGGPGSGCTTTAKALGEQLGLPVFDSDSYFHKTTSPPFQEQYTPGERRSRLSSALDSEPGWILAGSVATWGLDSLQPTHGVFLNITGKVRLERLIIRQRNQFGSGIDPGGDMEEAHRSFMEWSAGYEERTDVGRNLHIDRAFLEAHCAHFLMITGDEALGRIVSGIVGFLSDQTNMHGGLATAGTAINQKK